MVELIENTNNNIPEELYKTPYKYICEHYEKMLPCVGSRVFMPLCLLPVSLIIPKLIINGREIRIHLNLMWLSPSGYGKSTVCREFAKITYNPLVTKKMSTPRLYHELMKKRKGQKTSLVVEDVAVWFMDDEKIKFLEGATGEEESVSHETMRNIKDNGNTHTDVSSFCSGTPENITNLRLKEGILRRFSMLVFYLSEEEHQKILNFIHGGVCNTTKTKDSEEIQAFYKELKTIQEGLHPKIPQITGYNIPDYLKSQASEFMRIPASRLHKKYGGNLATEAEQMWRFAVCHAFLNIFNKYERGMIKDGILTIDQRDFNVAKFLLKQEISAKFIVLQCIEQLDFYNIKTRETLREWKTKMKDQDIPPEALFIMESNVK